MLSRKRLPKSNTAFVPPLIKPSKLPKTDAAMDAAATPTRHHQPAKSAASSPPSPAEAQSESASSLDKMISVLADAGCRLNNPAGPPCLPSDLPKMRHVLDRVFSDDSSLRSQFLDGLSLYICSTNNFRWILLPSSHDGSGFVKRESLVRVLLLVPSIQKDIQSMLLEKLPEYFDMEPGASASGMSLSSRFDEDVARLILNQFRWLDFLMDSEAFTEKLLEVLSICPLHLKNEIIGSLPEIIGDQHNNKTVVASLQQMLQEDTSIIVPVLDAFSNLKLDNLLQDEVLSIALSCIRTIDVEHMAYLLRFLLVSVTPSNSRRIISQLRDQLKFVGSCTTRTTQRGKVKGKLVSNNAEASILDALRSNLQFNDILCQEILKELKSLEEARDHKVIDIWFLVLIHMTNKSLQKSVEKILRKRIVEGSVQEIMFDQCIQGNKDFAKDNLPTFLAIAAYLLACKEARVQQFGMHLYICLFEEFLDAYSRQEVLGALITHVGSGIITEVNASLDAMVVLASKHSHELIPLSSHIIGIMDYLESFGIENLHKVYEVFSHLALSARCSAQHFGCSIANEFLMILRKQVNNPDIMYKKMGLIGSLKIASYLGDRNAPTLSISQKSNYEEAVELLKTSLDSCKHFPLPLVLFYEELVSTLESRNLHPTIVEWVGTHVGEFESIYLSDLDGGAFPAQNSYFDMDGELWMNLDGDISPICLNIFPLVCPSSRSGSQLQVLPSKFVLLSVVERLANQGSLGGIDALLGCPLHLPSSKLFSETCWQSLTTKQKQIVILSLFYAANWITELLNVFSTQVVEGRYSISQATREEIILKLLKRLRNLIFIESLLNNCLKQCTVLLPELYPHSELSSVNESNHSADLEKMTQHVRGSESTLGNRKRSKKSPALSSSSVEEKLRQPTIVDVWRKAGAITNEEILNEDSSVISSANRRVESSETLSNSLSIQQNIEISAPAKFIEVQRQKFRPLSIDCFSILAFSENQHSCRADASAELPLHLYLLRDLHKKLDYFSPPTKHILVNRQNSPAGFMGMKGTDFLLKIRSLFPSFRRHLDTAVSTLGQGAEFCPDHWKTQCSLSGIPDIHGMVICVSSTTAATLVLKEILWCFGKILNLPDVNQEKSILLDLLRAFQPMQIPDCFFQGMNLIPSPGNIDYLYGGAYYFLEGVFDIASNLSFALASEVLLTLQSMVSSIQKFLHRSPDETGKYNDMGASEELLPLFRNKLGISAQKLLTHQCERDDIDDNLKGEIIQKILHIYLDNWQSTSDLLCELACSIMPQVSSRRTTENGLTQRFPTLGPGTLVIWYRVMFSLQHEENLTTLSNLVKEIVLLEKSRGAKSGNVESVLSRLQQCVNVVVSLVNMCRTNDKVTIHAMAVKYGGKFIDSFLKVFNFLQAQFQTHRELIFELVKELQKATRTIQTLCSEAKGLKQTAVTGKIPATKRSLERFLFHVKSLLYTTSSGCTFWMGNLKHKDLMGHVVSSQAYVDDNQENGDDDSAEVIGQDQPINDDSAEVVGQDQPINVEVNEQ